MNRAPSRPVIIESPFAGHAPSWAPRWLAWIARRIDARCNRRYARAALADSLRRGESPFASHLLYTQPGVLRDDVAMERKLGIDAGLAWGERADATVVYWDRGISRGMQQGIDAARLDRRPIEYRSLREWRKG